MKHENIYIDHDCTMVVLNAQSKNLYSTVDKSQKCLGICGGLLAFLF